MIDEFLTDMLNRKEDVHCSDTTGVVQIESNIRDESLSEVKRMKKPKIFSCPKCGEKRAQFRSAMKHCQSRVPKTKSCPVCSRVMDRKNMKRHLRVHEGKNLSNICDICSDSFSSNQKLNDHRQNVHDIVEAVNGEVVQIKCTICDFVHCKASVVKRHITKKHAAGVTLFCDQCEFVCHSSGGMSKHKNLVHKELSVQEFVTEDEILQEKSLRSKVGDDCASNITDSTGSEHEQHPLDLTVSSSDMIEDNREGHRPLDLTLPSSDVGNCDNLIVAQDCTVPRSPVGFIPSEFFPSHNNNNSEFLLQDTVGNGYCDVSFNFAPSQSVYQGSPAILGSNFLDNDTSGMFYSNQQFIYLTEEGTEIMQL